MELILDTPLNENFFNDEPIADLIKTFKSQEITTPNNLKTWIIDGKNTKNEELLKLSITLNKTLKCFYQCEECLNRNIIDSFMDHIFVKVNFIFSIHIKRFN